MVDAESLREMIHCELLAVRDRFNQDNTDLDVQGILEVVDELMHCVVLLDSIKRVSEQVFKCLIQECDVLSRNTNRDISKRGSNDITSAGRPSFDIRKEQDEYLLDCNFTVKEMSEILHASKRTLERRMSEYNLTGMDRYTEITYEQFDNTVVNIKQTSPHCVSKLPSGYLRSLNIHIKRSRV